MDERYLRSVSLRRLPYEGSYLASLPAVRALSRMGELEFAAPITFLVGENGTGKSTLLEAIAIQCGFNPEGGTLNFTFSTYDSHSELYKLLSLTKGHIRPGDGFFLRAESFYNAASYIDELDSIDAASPPVIESYGGVSLHAQSHGESFFSLITHRFGGKGLYLLDEPEAALSPSRQMALLVRLHQLAQMQSQFVIATHSPILLSYPGARIYELSDNGIRSTRYEDTQTYRITKDFLDHPQRMLKYLLEE